MPHPLETNEQYFGLVAQLQHECQITQNEAWNIVEKIRVQDGLEPRCSTYESFRTIKKRYMACGGAIERFEWKELSAEN